MQIFCTSRPNAAPPRRLTLLLLALALAIGAPACGGDDTPDPVDVADAGDDTGDDSDAGEDAGSDLDANDDPDVVDEPDAAEPDADQPDADQPDADQPDADEPDADEPEPPGELIPIPNASFEEGNATPGGFSNTLPSWSQRQLGSNRAVSNFGYSESHHAYPFPSPAPYPAEGLRGAVISPATSYTIFSSTEEVDVEPGDVLEMAVAFHTPSGYLPTDDLALALVYDGQFVVALEWIDAPAAGLLEDRSARFTLPAALTNTPVRPAIIISHGNSSSALLMDNVRLYRLPATTLDPAPYDLSFEAVELRENLFIPGVPGWNFDSTAFVGVAHYGPGTLPGGASEGNNVAELEAFAFGGPASMSSPPIFDAQELRIYSVSVDLNKRADVPGAPWVDLELINPFDGSVAASKRMTDLNSYTGWVTHSLCWSVPNGMGGDLRLNVRVAPSGGGVARTLVDNIVVTEVSSCPQQL